MKNSDVYTKILQSAPKITKTRKLKTCFPSIVSICVHTGHKNKQKDKNSMFFINIHPGLKFAPDYICSICPAIRPQMPPLFFYNLYGSFLISVSFCSLMLKFLVATSFNILFILGLYLFLAFDGDTRVEFQDTLNHESDSIRPMT